MFNVIANRNAEWIAAAAVKDLRHDLFEKINTLSANQVDQLTRPSLISRMTTDTYNMYQATGSMQRLGIRAPVLLLGGIAMSLLIDPVLTLVMISLLPLILVIVYFTSKVGVPLYKKTQKSVDKLIRTLREYVTGMRVVRALSMNAYELNRFDKNNKETIERELEASITMARINPLMQAVMNIGLVIVLVFGAYRVDIGLTARGEILAFVTYFTIILNAMMSITRVFVLSSRASASGERIYEVLDLPISMQDGNKSIIKNKKKPHIKFEHVSFSYLQKEKNLIDINFELYKGQTLGIIGATGSGKTTLINLLMRFYDVDQGSIKLFGTDLRDLKQNELRESIGVVFQNDLIFADTIYGNIQFNRRQITDEDVDLATEVAQANFIYEKENQNQYQMSQKGMNLSGGQKQRVLIARAIAGKPDLIILDDASSALDYRTDMKLRKSINEKHKDASKIIIAQRISSIKDADLILLIDEGRVLAQGTHEQLLESSEMYQKIASYQLGGETL
jgi:ATP-binding cassette subfamily B protein